MCAFCIGLRTPADTLLLTTFICAGLARLARFNATVALVPKDDTGKSKYFEGLPIPSSLGLCAIMAELVRRGAIVGGKGLPFGLVGFIREYTGIEVHWASFVFLGWATLFISKTLRYVLFLDHYDCKILLSHFMGPSLIFLLVRHVCRVPKF